jgi:hypothetical protein
MLDGMVLLRLLFPKSTCVRYMISPMPEGMAPLSILLLREMDRSHDSALMLDGMVLLNLLPLQLTYPRDVASPIAEGMEPLSILLSR